MQLISILFCAVLFRVLSSHSISVSLVFLFSFTLFVYGHFLNFSCMTFDVKNHITTHLIWPACIFLFNTCFIDSCQLIHAFSWWFCCFSGCAFRGMIFALLLLGWFWCSPPPPLQLPSCTTPSHPLVVAPPSLPCSPPPSCLDPSPLSQASPLHRDTPRSHDDGGNHNRGRSRFIC